MAFPKGTMAMTLAPWLFCGLLQFTLGSKLSYPGSDAYDFGQSTYWSNFQLETIPICRVQPSKAVDVSAILLILEFTQCQFAVKSGGHAAFTGGSNIDNGVTIDMRSFNTVSLSTDKTTTTVGTGNRWQAVYDYLVPQGYIAVGGRVGNVVLATGLVVIASATSNPDLYWALRGGGNNFGIVTNFQINTFKAGDLWGGFYVTPGNSSLAVYTAFESFVQNSSTDLDAGFIAAASFNSGVLTIASILSHAANNANATIFQPLFQIPKIESSSFLASMPLTTYAIIMNSTGPAGYRESYQAWTSYIHPALQQQCLDIFSTEVTKILDVASLVPALNFQTIEPSAVQIMASNGGNALGLASNPAAIAGKLLVSNLAFLWSNASDDARVFATIKSIRSQCITAAQNAGLFDQYIYQNYASIDEDVFSGYGATNKASLLAISRKYDPGRFLQTLQPGYFKIGI
ncbi:hypothetical protein ACEPPN_019141 [Leptodophora sp. 'Broadleaf-Isolate-01']